MGLFGGKKPASAEPPKEPAATPAPKKGCCGGCRVNNEDDKFGMLPDNKRKCRDAFCCTIFLVFWVGMLIIGGIGIKYGKWQRLVYGTDYKGNVCGVDKSGQKFVTYPRTNEDFIANLGVSNPMDYKFYGICVSSCPAALDTVCNYELDTSVYNATIVDSCMNNVSYTPPSPLTCDKVSENCWVTPQKTSSLMFRCIPDYNVTNSEETTCSYPAGVTSANDPRCIIVTESKSGTVQRPAKPNMLFDQLNSGRQLWGRWFGDLARAWWVILVVAVGFALVLGFTWVTLLKYCTGCMVWTTIFLVLTMLSFLTGYFYYKAGLVTFTLPTSLNDKFAGVIGEAKAVGNSVVSTASSYVPQSWSETNSQYMLSYSSMAYISTIVTVIVLCIVIAMRNAIRVSVEVLKIGTEALRSIPTLLLFPCTNVIAIGVFLVWWVFVAACLSSAGQLTTADLSKDVKAGMVALEQEYGVNATQAFANMPSLNLQSGNSTYTVIADMPVMNYLIIYHIFGLLWTTSFIQGVAAMTVAGAVAGWYFSQLPKSNEGVPELEKRRYAGSRCRVTSSLCRVLRYYLGSVAFGSFLIALIQAIRAAFTYLQKRLEPQAKNNQNLKFLLYCIQCCLACIQKAIEVVTRNAYIFVALKGESFCASGGKVFSLIRKHGSVFVMVNVLGEIIMFLGKVTISAACAWLSYLLLDTLPQFQPGGAQALSSTWLPVLAVLFFSYATASGFMMIFDLSVDTVLVCYCTDMDENNGTAIHFEKAKLDARGKASKGWFGSKKGVDGASSGSGSPTTGDPKTTNPATGASVKA